LAARLRLDPLGEITGFPRRPTLIEGLGSIKAKRRQRQGERGGGKGVGRRE